MTNINKLKTLLFGQKSTLRKIEKFTIEKADLTDYTAMVELLNNKIQGCKHNTIGNELYTEKLNFINNIAKNIKLNRLIDHNNRTISI